MRVIATCITAPSRPTSAATCHGIPPPCSTMAAARRVRPISWRRPATTSRMVEAAPNVRAALKARLRGQCENLGARARRSRRAAGRIARSHRAAFGVAIFERGRARSPVENLPRPGQAGRAGDRRRRRAGALRRALRRARAIALRRRQRLLLGGGRRADADFRVGLSAAEEHGRPLALRRGGHAGQAQGRRLRGRNARRAISATTSGA